MKITKRTIGAATAVFGVSGLWLFFGPDQLLAQLLNPVGRHGEEIAIRNETAYGYKGVISGRVTLDNGAPAVGFPVRARFTRGQTGAQGEGEAVTGLDGRYRIHGLNPQGFRVQPENGGKPYIPDSARTIELKQYPGTTAENVDFHLHLGPQITIRVHDAQTGTPVAGLTVKANQSEYTSPFPIGVTDANGEYRFRAGQLNTQVNLEPAQAQRNDIGAAPGSSFYQHLGLASVAGIHDVVWDIKTYRNAYNPAPYTFRGTVTGPDGKLVAGASVRMVRDTQVAQTTTDAVGRFTFTTNRMGITEYGNWDGRQRKGILFEAKSGDLSAIHYATPDETWSTIPIQITKEDLASVTGQVVSPSGVPLANVSINYNAQFPEANGLIQSNGGFTDSNGHFIIRNLSSKGLYSFRFGGVATYGAHIGSFGITEFPAVTPKGVYEALSLKSGERHDIGKVVVWAADSVVAGRLTAKSTPLQLDHLLVVVRGKHTDVSQSPKPDGSFRLEHIVREPLMLYVFYSDDPQVFSYTPGDSHEMGRTPVQAGDESVNLAVRYPAQDAQANKRLPS